MKLLYLDCVSGISGDMTVGALLDLGLDTEAFRAGLASLGLDGWDPAWSKARKGVLAGTAYRPTPRPDLVEPERHLAEIEALILAARLPEPVVQKSLAAFRLLAEAESRVHGVPVETIHFHEVGAGDAILDIVGAALAIHLLAPDRVLASSIPMTRGWVRCRHGRIPLPAPATLALAEGVPITRPPQPVMRELATPTGLAIARTMTDGFGELPEATLLRSGYGLGKAELPWPNVLRAILLETPDAGSDQVALLETNLDDMTPEALAFATERLLGEGALDVWLTPILMKKGRPGHTLSLLCPSEAMERFAGSILRETSSLGVRHRILERTLLPREQIPVETPYGTVRCKVAHLEGKQRVKPEYEDCRAAALASGASLAHVQEAALAAFLDARG
ncbi:nickel pincer cofactor biosynthesis protein LarC [Holophaga foetida]|uniref:nickel pincer cofactor biosynthesis protein LarC n=1 Tax=Holophaga foetida TaxID=35839 RepID=UPI0002471813|nr:nickel pincer cofactor biosynthesis protein LarC [Holophaga foetida]